MEDYAPLQNLYENNPMPSNKVFQFTYNDPVTGKHLSTQRLNKFQCSAMEMKPGKPTSNCCKNFPGIETKNCWYHLLNYFNIVVLPTHRHDCEGHMLKRLGYLPRVVY